MITVTSPSTQAEKAPGVVCGHCSQTVKLNEIVRSATHDLGCKRCFGK